MRSGALAISWLTCWSCTHDHPTPDAPDPPQVSVEDRLTYRPLVGGGCKVRPVIGFDDPNGAALPSDVELPFGSFPHGEANMPDGGSVFVTSDHSDSPSDQVCFSWSVAGVKPGDHFVFGGGALALPADCEVRAITTWTFDPATHTATWTDPDAASVDLRIMKQAFGGCTGGGVFFINCQPGIEIDGSNSTSVATEWSIATPPALRSVEVVACPNESYDDIRTLVTPSLAAWGPPY